VFQLDEVVPWGRSFDEYCRMFALSDEDLTRRILGCGDGPASFNADATRRGATVISCDPIYRFDAADIRQRIAATRDHILEQTRLNAGDYVWSSIRSIDELDQLRMTAMTAFLDDFPHGKAQGRYIEGELPALPFADQSFDLALCSHLLFLYSEQLGEVFHQHAIRELCRVAREVRIFPLIALNWNRSPFVDDAMADLRGGGQEVSIEHVPYEFARGANQMLRVRRRTRRIRA
jgi:methyltransferase family protein